MLEIIKESVISFGTILIALMLNIASVFGISHTSYEQASKQIAKQDSSIVENTAPEKIPKTPVIEKETEIKTKESINNEKGLEVKKERQSKNTDEVTNSVKAQIIIPPQNTPAPSIDSDKLNEIARNALVNVICTTKSSGPFNPSSGSGIIIDPRGIVLTNAHVAQYFLLEKYKGQDFMDCILRTGSPAYPSYDAEILYISPAWIKENKRNIILDNPTGTGENDFALLRINKHIRDGINLPDKFPSVEIEMSEGNMVKNTEVLIVGYPAGFLGGTAIQKNLWPVTTFSYITNIFTFVSGTLDLVSLNGNIAAQKGSSGGGVINTQNGKLIGIIVTSTEAEQTGDRILNAITSTHINRSIFSEIGMNLETYLSGDLVARADNFNQTVSPSLTELLEAVLEK